MKSSRWRNPSDLLAYLKVGVIAPMRETSSKIRIASVGEDLPVQLSSAQSRKHKGRAFETGMLDCSLLVTLKKGHN